MRPGNVVDIFEDPVTCTRREGAARLVRLIKKTEKAEYWKVHFLADPEDVTYERWI